MRREEEEEEQKERRGFTPDPTRLVNVNKEKTYTRETREATQTPNAGRGAEEAHEGRRRKRVGSSKLLYLGRSPLSENDPGAIIFPKPRLLPRTRSLPSLPFSFLFFLA